MRVTRFLLAWVKLMFHIKGYFFLSTPRSEYFCKIFMKIVTSDVINNLQFEQFKVFCVKLYLNIKIISYKNIFKSLHVLHAKPRKCPYTLGENRLMFYAANDINVLQIQLLCPDLKSAGL